MTIGALLLTTVAGVFASNFALEQFLGLTPFLGFSGKNAKSFTMGLCVTVVMLLTTAAAWALEGFVLTPLALGYLRVPVFAALVLCFAYLLGWIFKKAGKDGLGRYFPLVALNSAVLGVAVITVTAGCGIAEALFTALGAGLGFALMMPVMQGVIGRIDMKHVPKAFQGLPVYLLAASIISMVLVAFK